MALCSLVTSELGVIHLEASELGKPRFPKSDEFLENFRTALAPPPRPFFGKKCCDFFPNRTKPHQICNEIFQIGNDPLPFLTFFRKIMTKIGIFKAKNDPPPSPFGNFPKIHPFCGAEASLKDIMMLAIKLTYQGDEQELPCDGDGDDNQYGVDNYHDVDARTHIIYIPRR